MYVTLAGKEMCCLFFYEFSVKKALDDQIISYY